MPKDLFCRANLKCGYFLGGAGKKIYPIFLLITFLSIAHFAISRIEWLVLIPAPSSTSLWRAVHLKQKADRRIVHFLKFMPFNRLVCLVTALR